MVIVKLINFNFNLFIKLKSKNTKCFVLCRNRMCELLDVPSPYIYTEAWHANINKTGQISTITSSNNCNSILIITMTLLPVVCRTSQK